MTHLHECLPHVWIRVSGPLACFSQPEFSVERMSYPWITPSAARGVFEAVLWKPRIRYEIREIQVLAPIRYLSLRRNEVETKLSTRGLDPDRRQNVDEIRQQRNTIALRDVDYLVGADLTLNPAVAPDGPDDNHGKYVAMLERRLAKGQCFHAPYLGCREFAAEVRPRTGDEHPIPVSMDLGWMLYDFFYPGRGATKADGTWKKGSGPEPLVFRARMEDGVVGVPPRREVLERLPEGRR